MSTTPRVYSEDELQAAIAAELLKQRLLSVETRVIEAENRTAVALEALKIQLATMAAAVDAGSNGLRTEIKNNYALKAEVTAEFTKADILVKAELKTLSEAIKNQWQKLVLITGTVSAVGLILQYGFSIAKVLK